MDMTAKEAITVRKEEHEHAFEVAGGTAVMQEVLRFSTTAQAYHAGWISALAQALEDIEEAN